MLMYAVLHGIAQTPVGKAQNLAQNELKFSYSDEHRYLCVGVCCFAWNSSNSSGESSKASSKCAQNFHIVMNTGTCVLKYAVLRGIAQIPVGNSSKSSSK